MPDPLELSQSVCEALLRAGVVGRAVVDTPEGLHIVPVNYSVVDGAIVIRTAPASRLGRYGGGAAMVFEVDDVDYDRQRGWSVVARGRSEAVSRADEIAHIESQWPPRPWASGERPLFLRLAEVELSGRQLGEGWNPLHGLRVRRTL